MRLLIVDDDPEWLAPLHAMYEMILGTRKWEIVRIDNYLDAVRRLRDHRVDLLSLDIILAGERTPDEKGHVSDASGLTLLRQASEHHWTNGVILITGLQQDGQLSQVLDEGETVAKVRMTFSEIAGRHFPGKHIILNKQDKLSVQDNLDLFEEELKTQKLHRLAKAATLPPPYTLDLVLDDEVTRVVIKSKKGNRRIHEIGDATFLRSLALMTKAHPGYVSKYEAYELFLKIETYRSRVRTELSRESLTPEHVRSAADAYVENTGERLERIGINPKELFVVERGWGWKLHPEVTVIGLNADVGRGYGGDARPLENRAFGRDEDEDDETPSDNA